MTVETQTFEVNAPTSASTFTYSFSPIVIFATTDLVVIITNDTTGIETTLSEGTGSSNYAVVVSAFPGTGSITYPADSGTEAGTGSTLNIKRVLTLEQATNLENQGGYFPEVLEQQLDKSIMIDLQQQEELDRTFKASPGESTLTTLTLPNSDTVTSGSAANLGINAAHTALAYNITAGTISTPVSIAEGGTNATSEGAARTNLGLVIGTDVQAFDADTTKNDVNNTFTKAQRGSPVTLTSSSAAVVIELNDGNNFIIAALQENTTLSNPTSTPVVGQSGTITVIQDGGGTNTMAFGTQWLWGSGTDGVLSTGGNAIDLIGYEVISTTKILCTIPVKAAA